MTTPAWANDHCTRPEQSKDFGPFAPQMYGMPSRLSAARSMVRSTFEEARPPVTGGGRTGARRRAAGGRVAGRGGPADLDDELRDLGGMRHEFLDLVGQLGELGTGRADHDRVAHREPERPGDPFGDDRVNATDADSAEAADAHRHQ